MYELKKKEHFNSCGLETRLHEIFNYYIYKKSNKITFNFFVHSIPN